MAFNQRALHRKRFNSLLQSLNPAQREAVSAIEGPVIVVAGPGTGKTQVLTLRIANILLQTDTSPDSILALTFTQSGAESMRERLVGIIGDDGYRVEINTFHGFANNVIRQFPEFFPAIVGGSHLDRVGQIKLVEEIIARQPLKLLKPTGNQNYYVLPALTKIDLLKREGVAPSSLSLLLADSRGNKSKKEEIRFLRQRELLSVYRAYESLLRERKLYDYGDMITSVVSALETNSDLRLRLQEEFHYWLADEHQDANNSQNKLLFLLASFHDNPNLFIVGDQRQAIYQFQGASLENFDLFVSRYPKARIINLTKNYRGTQSLLDVADTLISKSALPKWLTAGKLKAVKSASGKTPRLLGFSRPDLEMRFVAEDIRSSIKSGIAPSDIVVLFRDNGDALAVTEAFQKAGLPYVLSADTAFMLLPDANKILILLRALRDFGDDEALAAAMVIDFLGLPFPLLSGLFNYWKETGLPLTNILSSPLAHRHLAKNLNPAPGFELTPVLPLRDFLEKLTVWRKSFGENPVVFLEKIVRESGLLKDIISSPDAVRRLEALEALFGAIKNSAAAGNLPSVSDLVGYLEALKTYRLPLNTPLTNTAGVRLMTAHKAKGLEFRKVYIVQAYSGHWGRRRRADLFSLPVRDTVKDDEDPDEAERRLFYVAMTRAREELTITYSRFNYEGRRQLPSRFVADITANLKEVDTAEIERRLFGDRTYLGRREIIFMPKFSDRTFVRERFLRQGLSITALNNYLECPWKYFFLNLVRLPRTKTASQAYGTAVHAALKDFFDHYRDRARKPGLPFLLRAFKKHLSAEIISPADRAILFARGKSALSGYYRFWRNRWPTNVENEMLIKGVLLSPEVRLTGKLDKVEFWDDGRGVSVVDYKTGIPQSRRRLSGETLSDGGYKRQLIFYKLLLSKFLKGKYNFKEGVVDFVEPDSRGRFCREVFVISDEEVETLTGIIARVADDILNLAFWNRFPHHYRRHSCRWCVLGKLTHRFQRVSTSRQAKTAPKIIVKPMTRNKSEKVPRESKIVPKSGPTK